MTNIREMMPPPGFSAPPHIPNVNNNERPPITTMVFAATTPRNTPFAYRVSTSTDPTPMISPAFVKANYEILESLLRDRQRQIRNEDLQTELEYFSEDYDKECEMESRPERTMEVTPPLRTRSPRVHRQRKRVVGFEEVLNREGSRTERNTEGNRPSKDGAKENGMREMNLPHFWQPTWEGTKMANLCLFANPTGSVTPFVCWIGDYPLLDGLKMPSHVASYDGKGNPDNFLHLFEGAIRMKKWLISLSHIYIYPQGFCPNMPEKEVHKSHLEVHNIKQREGESVKAFATRTRNLVEHLSTDLPPTYKGLMEKTYIWIKAREVATNGAPNDQRDNFERLLSSLSKSPREILATEKVAKTFEQPPRLPEIRELRHQMKEAVKSRQLAHLVKGIKKKKEKVSDTQLGKWKEERRNAKPTKTHVLMISRRSCNPKKIYVEEDYNKVGEITFSPLSDFKDINKACLKENHPLPATESKVEDIYQHRFKCFLDAYKGYHQIRIAKKDEEKMAFYTREGVFCYKRFPFGLKNAGETYQRLINKVFSCQVRQNMEVNANKMVIKSDSEEEIPADIKDTLERL
ncbi:hypothetical protein Tco_0693255 [Tanacetum coccineum]|uniref:Reverse transcriptase domain-containing protein n=1 Tax=Tanacetum coccineum TaxID=301880 RepID=A0ABQ4YDZ2_9ASTR